MPVRPPANRGGSNYTIAAGGKNCWEWHQQTEQGKAEARGSAAHTEPRGRGACRHKRGIAQRCPGYAQQPGRQ